ncbi:MAG: hypothetical protein KDK70_31950 [Myxococcales bacterium]|nr:hypothetical protein [Myxococcales bacterium]
MRIDGVLSVDEGDAWHASYSRGQLVREIEQLRDELRWLGGEIAMERHLRRAAERDLLAFVEHARMPAGGA